jgi:hypothetical protein
MKSKDIVDFTYFVANIASYSRYFVWIHKSDTFLVFGLFGSRETCEALSHPIFLMHSSNLVIILNLAAFVSKTGSYYYCDTFRFTITEATESFLCFLRCIARSVTDGQKQI